ncbi:MAG: PBP1A family penicillin-binding protein [Lachnospiraceae bacterium]|nr:PBP1A family penicillin-binding protein [Lachnospiraceae bacterium]
MSKKRKKKKRKNGSPLADGLFYGTQFILIFTILGCIVLFFLSDYWTTSVQLYKDAKTMVENSDREDFAAYKSSIVYDDQGEIIKLVKNERFQIYLSIDNIPQMAKDAIISIEDKKFYEHNGIDLKAITRAAVALVKKDSITQGGSTITQQLSRNIFLTHTVSWERKVEEIFISLRLEKIYSKDDILEFYLNNVYFSNGYYGIEAASTGYFNKSCNELNLSEIAFLCAIPNSPTMYNPRNNLENTLKRRNRILDEMFEDGKITAQQCQEAKDYTITLDNMEVKSAGTYVDSYVNYCATRALMEKDGFVFQNKFDSDEAESAYKKSYQESYDRWSEQLVSGGYRIYTTINRDMEEKLQAAVDENMYSFVTKQDDGVYNVQAAATCIDNDTGKVKAIVGGRTQEDINASFNRAYQSKRQPGSSIKPLLVYAPALEKGYSANSSLKDVKTEDGPSNSGDVYSGSISLRSAVEKSRNAAAWNLYKAITPSFGLEYLYNMEFSGITKEDYNLSTALGGFTSGFSTVEMASGYATLENNGLYRTPTCIDKILDANGNVVIDSVGVQRQVYSEKTAKDMTDILKGVLTRGTGVKRRLKNITAAAKTGTTNENKDGWFCGYTAYYTTAVWVGFDIPKELEDLSGSTYPGQIWNTYMESIHEGRENREMNQ